MGIGEDIRWAVFLSDDKKVDFFGHAKTDPGGTWLGLASVASASPRRTIPQQRQAICAPLNHDSVYLRATFASS